MSGDRAFFDTNILVYLVSDEPSRAARIEDLLADGGIVSVQVLNEFASVCRRKKKIAWPEIKAALAEIREVCDVIPLNVEIHDEGLRIAERYGFSVYDSLIVAAAISSGCNTLYSEDMQDKQVIGTVTISNPFKAN